jgi:hypothetical protein
MELIVLRSRLRREERQKENPMALQLGALRDALEAAGAGKGMACAAAEEVAAYQKDIQAVRSDLMLLTWMAGANMALTAAVLLWLFTA